MVAAPVRVKHIGRNVAIGEGTVRELRRSNNLVYLSAAEAFLRSEGFSPIILDAATSAAEGSIGAIPRRLMVPPEESEAAGAALADWEAAHG